MCMNRSFGAAVIGLVEVVGAQRLLQGPALWDQPDCFAIYSRCLLLTWVEPMLSLQSTVSGDLEVDAPP